MSFDDSRNNKSWRVENEIKLSPHHHSSSRAETRNKSKNSSKRLNQISQTSHNIEHTPNSVTTTKTDNDTRYIDIESATATLWRHNLVGYIDNFGRDLYKHCEELNNDEVCREVSRYFQERVVEFTDLANRVESQRRLEKGESNSAAWSVSTRDMTRGLQPSSTTPPKRTHTLRASAHEFTPSATTRKLFNPDTSSVGSDNNKLAAHLAMVAASNTNSFTTENHTSNAEPRGRALTESNLHNRKAQPGGAGMFPSMGEEPSAATQGRDKLSSQFPPQSQLDSDGSTSLFSTKRDSKTTKSNNTSKASKPSTTSNNPQHAKSDSFDLTESRVEQARERVWETAEALVDAALVAEEQQWVTLGLSQKQTFRKTFHQEGTSKLTLDTSRGGRSHNAHLSPEDRDDEDFAGAESYRQSGPSSRSVDYHDCPAPLQSPGSVHSASGFHSAMRSSFSLNGSPFYTSNGSYPSSFVSPAPNSAGKALHDKLSSPDRKRSHNIDEQKKRNNDRHNAANQNREQETEKKRLKGRAVSDKVEEARLREQEKLNHKGEELQRKRSEAEMRHVEQVKLKKDRAGNENSKVEEVIFINTLNSECVADELNKKLVEAEARVLAAEGRRQQRLEDISSQQKTRNSRKVQQISELHMTQEREKMERFEKLQQKLRDVEDRKKERLVEMKRRDEVVVEVVGTAITLVSNASSVAIVNASVPAAPVEMQKKLTKKDKKDLLAVKNKFSQPATVTSTTLTPATDLAVGPSKTVEPESGETKVSKSKAKKAKRRANQAAALFQQTSEQDQFNQLLAAPSFAECIAESVIVTTTPADITASLQCISDSYQTVQQGIVKKIVLAARTAFVESASVVPAVTSTLLLKGSTTDTASKASFEPKSIDVHLTHMLSAYTAHVSSLTSPRATESSTSNPLPSSGKYSTTALQLLAADTPISVNFSDVEQDRLNGGGVHTHSVASPGHSPHHSIGAVGVGGLNASDLVTPAPVHQERQVKLNISLVLCTVNVTDPASVSQFISEGGVLLLRVLLGYEVGVLSSAVTFNETLNCSADPALGKSLGLIIFELIASCSQDAVGYGELFACGVPILLADIVSVLFSVQETLCRDTAHYQKYSDNLSEYNSDHAQDVSFPYCVSVLLPSAVKTVSVILKVEENTTAHEGVQSSDTFLWYLFCSSVFTSLVSSIRSDVQCLQYRHAHDSSLATAPNSTPNATSSHSGSGVDYKQYHSQETRESIVCSAQLVSAVGLFLRNSGGIYAPLSSTSSGGTNPNVNHVVKSIVQLSPQTHAHPKGRQLVSLLRRSEVVVTLVSLLYSLIVEFHHINSSAITASCTSFRGVVKVTRRGHAVNLDANNTASAVNASTLTAAQFRVFSSVITSLYHIASADVSLVQQLDTEQQVHLVRSVNFLLRSYVMSLDDGNTVNIFSTTSNASSSSYCLSELFTKAHAEESIKQLLMFTDLCCLRNVALQKECGLAVNITSLFAPEIVPRPNTTNDSSVPVNNSKNVPPTSLLVTLCRLSNKFYKDKKFKHCLLPCLLSMTLDVDANITTLRVENKLTVVTKYLEYYIADLRKHLVAQSIRGAESTVTTAASGEETSSSLPEKVHSVDPVEILVRISQLFPTDVWSTALVTYTSR